jgi:glucosamine-6-phosphate deaminase
MKIIKLKDKVAVGQETAKIFIDQINQKPNSVLGLATGSSPLETYQDLIKANQNHAVSFKDVVTFNLDEYVGLQPGDEQSYRYFMDHNLFDHLDIDKKKTHIPNAYDLSNPASYDEEIKAAGGIDLQLLGLGVNGHIGFNEPGTSFDSKTSVVNLVEETIEANARFFENKEDVPTQAVSMGLGTIMQAKKIVLIATGANKAEAIKHLVNDEPNTE